MRPPDLLEASKRVALIPFLLKTCKAFNPAIPAPTTTILGALGCLRGA